MTPVKKIVLNGSNEDDAIVLFSDDENRDSTCPLTMESLHKNNDEVFLKDCVDSIEKKVNFVEDKSWTEMKKDLMPLKNMGGIKIQKCGHEFSAVPFLYEVMTKVFKCPICRGGSQSKIALEPEKAPNNVPEETWKLLCQISSKVRVEDERQRRLDESLLPVDMQVFSVMEMYEVMPWQISFALYRSENPGYNERPFVIIPIHMRIDNDIVIDDDGHSQDRHVTLRSGDLNYRKTIFTVVHVLFTKKSYF